MKTRLSVLTLLAAILLSGCAKQKSKEELTFKELKSNAQVALKNKDYREAAEMLETIIARFSDHADIAKYKLALAQLYDKEERYPSSYELYSHYSKFYPGDINAETAKYRAIMAKFNQTLRDDCDQTATTEALNLCNEYLQNNSNQKYAKKVKDVQHTCQNKLINKEIYVFNFYLKRGKYESANSRLAHLEKEFLPKDKSLEARLLYLKCQLAQKTKKSEILKENLSRLATDYPETRYAHMAQALTSAPKFIF
jgi:outer membrane protein assembly factor BamD